MLCLHHLTIKSQLVNLCARQQDVTIENSLFLFLLLPQDPHFLSHLGQLCLKLLVPVAAHHLLELLYLLVVLNSILGPYFLVYLCQLIFKPVDLNTNIQSYYSKTFSTSPDDKRKSLSQEKPYKLPSLQSPTANYPSWVKS